jgi:tetratricopeptide (TPR) repeat protein
VAAGFAALLLAGTALASLAVFRPAQNRLRDLEAAAGHVERGLALDPANHEVISSAALLGRRLGRFDKAIELLESAFMWAARWGWCLPVIT